MRYINLHTKAKDMAELKQKLKEIVEQKDDSLTVTDCETKIFWSDD